MLWLSFAISLYVECIGEEKEPYEAKARVDKKRYQDEISGYKNAQAQPMNIDSGNESDSTWGCFNIESSCQFLFAYSFLGCLLLWQENNLQVIISKSWHDKLMRLCSFGMTL